MFGENALEAYKGREDSLGRQDLEATRALKLQKMQQNIITSGNEENRRQIQQNQADVKFNQQQDDRQTQQDRQDKANDAQKRLINNLNNDNWDNGIKDAFKGNYDTVNRYLTDNTEDNAHKPIKDELERGIGGKIIKVESGFGMDEAEVGDAKITFQRPNGEIVTDLIPMDEIGAMTGTARRMGAEAFTNAINDASTNVKTGALDLTKMFEMATLASANGDENGKKLLKTLESIQKKEGKGSFDINNLYGKLTEALEVGDFEKAKSTVATITAVKKAMSIGEDINPETTDKPLTHKERQDIKDKQVYKQLENDVRSIAPSNITPENIDDQVKAVNDFIASGKETKGKEINAGIVIDTIEANDEKTDVINLHSKELVEGRQSEAFNRAMRILQVAENASGVANTNPVIAQIGVLNGHSSLIKMTGKVADYYRNFNRPTYSIDKRALDNVKKNFNSMIGKNIMVLKSGRKVALNSLSTKLDDLYEVVNAVDGKLPDGTKVSSTQIKTAKANLNSIMGMKFDTQTFLIMKDLLKELSGSGVTNQELDSYRTKITGTDWTDSNAIIANMLASSEKALGSYNTGISNLMGMGASYTARKKLQNLRAGTQGLLDELGVKAYTNGLESDMLTDPRLISEQGKDFFKGLTNLSEYDERVVKGLINDLHRFKANNGGSIKGYDITSSKVFSRMPKKKQEETLEVIKSFIKNTPKRSEARRSIKPTEGVATEPDRTQPPILQGGTVEEYINNRSDEDKFLLANLIPRETDGSNGGGYTILNTRKKGNTAYGKFQVIASTVKDILPKIEGGKYSPEDFKAYPLVQEKVMTQLLKEYKVSLKSIGKPVNPTNIYTVHQLGMGRAKRFFNNTLTKDDYVVMWENLGDKTQKLVPKGSKQVVSYWVNAHRGGQV